MNKMKKYMNFGKLGKVYDSGRYEYPEDVMNYIFSLFDNLSSSLLDIGCGTGIATRQFLSKVKDLSGCDIDKNMIKIAEDYKDKINYYIAPTNRMSFDNQSFDLVTAFGAFHWFCDSKSVVEIKRILKRKGLFVVVNKNEVGNFKRDYKKMVEQIIGTKSPKSIKKNYDPVSILSENGFSIILKKKFLHTEEFVVSRAIEQMQSMSLWNLIPKNKKQEALRIFKNHLKKTTINGRIYRQLEIVVVSGNK